LKPAFEPLLHLLKLQPVLAAQATRWFGSEIAHWCINKVDVLIKDMGGRHGFGPLLLINNMVMQGLCMLWDFGCTPLTGPPGPQRRVCRCGRGQLLQAGQSQKSAHPTFSRRQAHQATHLTAQQPVAEE
jgi:hypothetical protein